MEKDLLYMARALDLARQARAEGEAPVGALIERDGRILGEGYNRREGSADPMAHAEILAIRQAARMQGDWRLEGCTLYVTLEPCVMCVGAALWSRIKRIVFGCREPKWGSLGSRIHLLDPPLFPHKIQVTPGILAPEAAALLKEFFKSLRKKSLSQGPGKNAPRGI